METRRNRKYFRVGFTPAHLNAGQQESLSPVFISGGHRPVRHGRPQFFIISAALDHACDQMQYVFLNKNICKRTQNVSIFSLFTLSGYVFHKQNVYTQLKISTIGLNKNKINYLAIDWKSDIVSFFQTYLLQRHEFIYPSTLLFAGANMTLMGIGSAEPIFIKSDRTSIQQI